MRNRRILVYCLGLLLVSLSACSDFSKIQKNGTDDDKYKAALKYYNKQDWYRAGVLFEEIIPKLRGSAEQELSQFNYAYTQYNQGLYEPAAQLFKRFYETFARSEQAPEAMYMYAVSLYKSTPSFNLDQSGTIGAMSALQDFVNTYPESEHVKDCTDLILNLRKRLERKAYERAKQYYKVSGFSIANYKSAVVAINNFQREFPDSEFNEELAYLKVDAQYSLAKNSLDTKQKERYQESLAFYQAFKEKYPNSKYLKQADKMVEGSQKELDRIAKEEKAREELKKQQQPAPNAPAKVTSGQ
ncbi:outer membrane assembly lipoprotein YfiO [Fibrella aestuarina BUZ 2]|uniref:Outer membrane assembly lipoprotein YfiO n=1 Tax=Fibrella aestuarina BUZ 2 TaxID=1166018 RepID=I0KCN6_9BACT|nr:outer membrane protein assembly factor BamD [Fibrella aestuarina]CCH01889.1 outer membrane assembly lipoprotein YfiO [Fibrella aestuarina BUZ 2]